MSIPMTDELGGEWTFRRLLADGVSVVWADVLTPGGETRTVLIPISAIESFCSALRAAAKLPNAKVSKRGE